MSPAELYWPRLLKLMEKEQRGPEDEFDAQENSDPDAGDDEDGEE